MTSALTRARRGRRHVAKEPWDVPWRGEGDHQGGVWRSANGVFDEQKRTCRPGKARAWFDTVHPSWVGYTMLLRRTAISLALSSLACGGKAEQNPERPDVTAEEACTARDVLWSMIPAACRPMHDQDACMGERVLIDCAFEANASMECLIEFSEPHCTEDAWDFRVAGGLCLDEGKAESDCTCEHQGIGCR